MSDRIDQYTNTGAKKSTSSLMFPFICALFLIIGIYAGSFLSSNGAPLVPGSSNEDNPNKLVNIINKIDEMYVDSVQKKALIDDAIRSILEKLDPHSYYISPEEMASMQEPLEGNFEGIGVEFMIQRDTLMVVNPIEGGPSESAGIAPGDRIVVVDGEDIAGKGLTNDKVMKLLKGEKGTLVNLGIQRRNNDELLNFEIVRDRIPIYSVVASVMVSEEVGYIKITRFAKNTYEEFMDGVKSLSAQGAKKLMIDLRGNGGGYLNSCIPMIEEFLESGQLIVYTEGKNDPRRDYKSRVNGRFKDMDVVVLINQGSASASEILAGALQDQDRSITVGRRSFGKGLVQNEIALPDESALRLTVARYYTPTGRSIQKPYGDGVDYENDYYDRFDHGELMSADSIQFADSLQFRTPEGRIVYGGGGIMPDIFVPIDTLGGSAYLTELSYSGSFRRYGFEYVERERTALEKYEDVNDFLANFALSNADLEEFYAMAEQDGIVKDRFGIERSKKVIQLRIMAYIARNQFGEEAYYRVLLEDDNIYRVALDVINQYDQYIVTDGKLNLLGQQVLDAQEQLN